MPVSSIGSVGGYRPFCPPDELDGCHGTRSPSPPVKPEDPSEVPQPYRSEPPKRVYPHPGRGDRPVPSDRHEHVDK